jgi:D-arabinose 1-dehydrogenase-like Zn-dependent alcohol dehydrogenase
MAAEGATKTDFHHRGDRAGWGYNHSSCLSCTQCLSGMDTYCESRAMYGDADLDQGSLSTHYIGRESFLFHIPDNMPNEIAAPLMCGGATVFNALTLHNIKPMDRVGIIGVGGLGHLAIQFAAKMGCETVVFSGSDSKKEEAKGFGASEFYATKGFKSADELLKAMGGKKLDQLMVTTSHVPDWDMWLPIIRNGGILCPVSVSPGKFEIPYTPLIMQGLIVWSTLVADRLTHRKMLEFAARHGVKPVIQKFKFGKEGIEEAFKVLEGGKMRYRGVLVMEG